MIHLILVAAFIVGVALYLAVIIGAAVTNPILFVAVPAGYLILRAVKQERRRRR